MKIILISLFFICACQSKNVQLQDLGDTTTKSGWVSVFQTLTSDKETTLNILRPRLTDFAYFVQEDNKPLDLNSWEPSVEQKIISTTSGPQIHWKVDRIFIKNLSPNKNYRLLVVNKQRKRIIDYRYFKTLNLDKSEARFIVGSCMSDSHAFEHVRNLIWDQMLTHQADFLMLLGDQVYVDDFDFVKRDEASEFDIWTRYIDSFRKIPLFQNKNLIPILSIWDDHDFGTNNSNKNFKSKVAAKKIFSAFFGGEPIKDVFNVSKNGVSFSFTGFNQKFIFMDNRYYREPNPKSSFGHWGKEQHQWFKAELSQSKSPVWLANGGQFFTKATFINTDKGKPKQINETFVDDHPTHFKTLLDDLKKVSSPVVFLSGDIHYSEIAKIEKSILGYETFEVTSSPIHSYIFRESKGPETWLNNPKRIVSVKEHNYLVIDSRMTKNSLDFTVESYGIKQKAPYFQKKLQVQKDQ